MKQLIALSLLLLAASCKQKPEELIVRKWQEVSVENEQMNAAIREQQLRIDTMGRSTDAAANLAIYGVANVDSLKMVMQSQMDQFRMMQQATIDSTWFDFRKNGTVYLHSDAGMDSAAWYIEEDSALILDEMKLKGAGSKIRMNIEHLSDTALKLRFVEQHLNSLASFVPYKK